MHWNETLQQWEDITTLLDKENNLIYGETSHLSIFTVFTKVTVTISGDFNGDGAVDGSDFYILLQNWGKGNP
jgi:hypothetical protein